MAYACWYKTPWPHISYLYSNSHDSSPCTAIWSKSLARPVLRSLKRRIAAGDWFHCLSLVTKRGAANKVVSQKWQLMGKREVTLCNGFFPLKIAKTLPWIYPLNRCSKLSRTTFLLVSSTFTLPGKNEPWHSVCRFHCFWIEICLAMSAIFLDKIALSSRKQIQRETLYRLPPPPVCILQLHLFFNIFCVAKEKCQCK